MTSHDTTRARFAATADRLAALGDRRVAGLRERIRGLVPLQGDERALDAGTGTGPLAFALAPLVREVVAVDLVPEMLAQARARAGEHPNVELVEGDLYALPFPDGSFDLVASARTLHHLDDPGAAVHELGRVLRAGGRALVIDQVAPDDERGAALQEQIERLRDPSHVRTLPDGELQELLASAGLEVERCVRQDEDRDLEEFLVLGGCEGEAQRPVLELAAAALERGEGRGLALRREDGRFRFCIPVGWYLARRL